MPCPTFTRQLSSFHALTVQLSTFDDTAHRALDKPLIGDRIQSGPSLLEEAIFAAREDLS